MLRRLGHSLPYILVAVFLPAALPPPAKAALDANGLALVVNRNMPDGLKLAELYAKERQVPDNRIIELDLPKTEQMPFEAYERDVAPPVRQFLRINDPLRQVKCLVTFYGVPFRIAAHVDTPAELAEVKGLRVQLKDLQGKLQSLVVQSETTASSLDESFKPAAPASGLALQDPGGELNEMTLNSLIRRVDRAGKSIVTSIRGINDPEQRQNAQAQFLELVRQCNGPVDIAGATANPASTSAPSATGEAGGKDDPVVAAMPVEDRRFDPVARELLRHKSALTAGIFNYSKLILAQIGYLSPEDTEAATDSELSLLWYAFYPRPKWQLNTLCHRFDLNPPVPALMVSRLDAPTPDVVRQMILDSVQAENQGLRGRVVIDARGLPLDGPKGKPDSFALYDDSLRRLAALVHLKTKMPLTFDDNPEVLPAHSAQDVALYCGWYSVGKYVPCCSFVPGAVGFHIASYEMVSLRDPSNTGWVRGLLNDGVAATLGPVSEPYLAAFPPADEFFALLLTGKMTLAEVYWKTEVMASWRMCLVGDPLYTPFKAHPQLKVDDLPAPLQSIFQPVSQLHAP